MERRPAPQPAHLPVAADAVVMTEYGLTFVRRPSCFVAVGLVACWSPAGKGSIAGRPAPFEAHQM